MTNGQDTTFNKKVQQLFFDVDVSNHFTSLVDTFANIKELTYKKPGEYGIHRLTGIDWTYTFKFTGQPYLTSYFDTGLIKIKVTEKDKRKKFSETWWALQFDKMDNNSLWCVQLYNGCFFK